MQWKRQNKILFGGDYNPDQWDEETVKEDMRLLKEAGVNTLTLPVFSWAKLEPEEGVYDFQWLDAILERIQENGFSFFLATPTCAQPAWMSKKYPEVLPVDIAGRKRTHGMRVFFCVNSEKYRERAAAITRAMAERYRDYAGLLGWHVANEYGTYCYCENCQRKFRKWLNRRYGTVDCLNEKWNTAFWGRILYDFDEVMLPTELNDDYRFNPEVQLDYMRFMTDSTIECFENEADIIKAYTPELPVLTNISGFIKKLDQFKMVSHMDIAGWDNYPWPTDERSFPAFKHDIMRALKGGASYYVMEQSPNQQNWQAYCKVKRPGELRRIAYQGLAHGSDSSLYFQMRQSVAGQEKLHGALISHNGRSDTRIFREMTAIGKEFAQLGAGFLGGRTNADVGILFDWENWWALELCSGPTQDMDYLKQVHYYYRPFYYRNIPVDILQVTSDFSGYRVIAAPLLYMLKDGVAERLAEFVAAGGTLIGTYMTGYADENDRCIFGAYPGPLRDVFGIWVEETDALFPGERNTLVCTGTKMKPGKDGTCGFLCDLLHTETAETAAVYGNDFYQGMPAVTVNHYGRGKAYYLASQPDEEFLQEFVDQVCAEAHVAPVLWTEGEIEAACRENETGKTCFLINHGDSDGKADLGGATFINLLSGEEVTGEVEVRAKDVMIFQKKMFTKDDPDAII